MILIKIKKKETEVQLAVRFLEIRKLAVKKKGRIVSAYSPGNDHPTTAVPLRILFPTSNYIIPTAA